MLNSTSANFGEWVRQKRLEQKFSQEELAYRCGLTRQHIWNIEKSASGVKRSTVEMIASALGVSPTEALKAAGYLPTVGLSYSPDPEAGNELDQLAAFYRGLPPDKQDDLLNIARMYYEKSEKSRTIGKRVAVEQGQYSKDGEGNVGE